MRKVSFSLPIIYIFLFFLSAGILLNFVIPPFQNPDEPQHFGAILTFSLGNENKDYIEQEIIKLMDKNEWWKFVGMGTPNILPAHFREIEYLGFSDFAKTFGNVILYHYLLGKFLKFSRIENIQFSYYCCRFISIFLILGALLFLYFIFRKASSLINNDFLFGIFFVLFIPQFVIYSVSVNSEALSIFLCSLFFFSAFSLIMEGLKIKYIVLLFLSASASFFTDRSVLFIIFLAAFFPFILFRKKKVKNSIVMLAVLFILFALLIVTLKWSFPEQFGNSLDIVQMNLEKVTTKIIQPFSLKEVNRQFFPALADSFLLKFGWMAFSANKIFYYLWRTVALFTFLGVIIFFIKNLYSKTKKMHGNIHNHIVLKLTVFSSFAVFLQIVSLWITQGLFSIRPQGRYLFPVIFPISFLFVIGMKSLFDLIAKRCGSLALSITSILGFLFFNLVIWNYIIPVFHLMVKGPHTGV